MADTDDWGGVAVNAQPKPDDWGGIPVNQTSTPKIPDISGVQKMVQDNLAANDNKEVGSEPKMPQTPMDRLKTATGLPVDAIINGAAKSTDINSANRDQYVKALNNDSAVDGGDWMQSYFRGVGDTIVGGGARAVGTLAYPFLSDESKQKLIESGTLGEVPALTGNVTHDFAAESLTRANTLLSPGIGTAFTTIAAPLAPLISPAIETASKVAEKMGITPENASLIPAGAEFGMNLLGLGGLRAGLHYSEPIIDATAKKLGKESAAVTPSDVDQIIAQGSKDLYPPASDFKAVSTVTGFDETALQNIYRETGKRPEQIFEDAQANPAIAAEVAAGKVPEAYEHLIEPKPILPTERVENLQVSRDEATRSFNVVDADSDHVSGGFDSYEEARHYIEDEKFRADERRAIEEEAKAKPQDVLTPENAEATLQPKPPENLYAKIGSKVEAMSQEVRDLRLKLLNKKAETAIILPQELAEREALSVKVPSNVIPPSEVGKVTSLRTFLSNNGARFNESNELVSIKKHGSIVKGEDALEYAHEISKSHGYLPKDEAHKVATPVTELQNLIKEENGGRTAWRTQDAERVLKAKEAADVRQWKDPAFIEDQAYRAGIDTDLIKDETTQQRVKRLLSALQEFHVAQEGSGPADAIRQAIGATITTAEKFTGHLTGGIFDKLGEAYIKTFQPEMVGPLAKRADAFLAKYKASGQEAENAFYRQSTVSKKIFDRLTPDERMEWLYDHETGRWNEEENPDHARFQALYDAMHKTEQEAIGAETAYKENYLPHQWEDPEAVKEFFRSDTMIRKFGSDWFKKASEFKLIQEGVRAGFKLKTDNPESMLVARQLASDNMIRTMNLLKDMESSGIAKRSTVFSIDKKIAKTEAIIAEIQEKYKKEFEKANNPAQTRIEGVPPAVSKTMQIVEKRLSDLKARLEDFNKEKSDNKLTPEQMKALKEGFRVIGPDSHAWNIHQQIGPLWKNAMEMKGLWENQGVLGDAYRTYTQGKNIWTAVKLGLSLFHPVHVAMIHLASDIASAGEHLIQGGKFSDLALKDTSLRMGLTKDTLKGQDHPAVKAWKTAPEARTPEQQKMVQTMIEGGFKPTMSARDTIHFRENFDKAINGVGLNNLRLLGTAVQLPGKLMAPFFEHWIPGLKSEIYLRRAEDAMKRDPALAIDAGRRGEVLRQIAKDTDRTYGEMNNEVQFWNKTVRDSFNAAFISGGWKLAQIYNARGLLQPLKIAYDFAKTGEFSKEDITYNMLHAYTYTGLTLALGGAINAMLGNPIGTAKDTVWDIVKNLVAPQTGEKNSDGTPIRINQPAFAKEAYMLARDINTQGLLAGSAGFLYHTTLIPGIVDTLNNRDFIGREIISDPTDLHQWTNAGWDAISPISVAGYEKAESKHSEIGKVAGMLGFPMAGAYMNQTPFEQKVLYNYSEQNPPKGDVYSAKLKSDLKSAIASGGEDAVESIKQRMQEEGMTDRQISSAEKVFDKPFVDVAWGKLSSADQKRLISHATDEEKERFKVKGD